MVVGFVWYGFVLFSILYMLVCLFIDMFASSLSLLTILTAGGRALWLIEYCCPVLFYLSRIPDFANYVLELRVVKGRRLPIRDQERFGKAPGTSDPYVLISTGDGR